MTTLNVFIDGNPAGTIELSDVVKNEAKSSIKKLKELGIKKTIMLTGDKKEVAKKIVNQVEIDDFRADLLPQEKVEEVEKYSHVLFVGDGINDAPALAIANVGIAMGGIGSDVAIDSANVIIMNDNLQKIPQAIEISKLTMKIAKQNIAFSIVTKFLFLIFGYFGLIGVWEAIFADVGVSLLVVLNSIRIIYGN